MASKCTTCDHNIKVKVAIVLSLGGVRRADRAGGGAPVAEPKQPKKRPDATQATDDGATLRHANPASYEARATKDHLQKGFRRALLALLPTRSKWKKRL